MRRTRMVAFIFRLLTQRYALVDLFGLRVWCFEQVPGIDLQ